MTRSTKGMGTEELYFLKHFIWKKSKGNIIQIVTYALEKQRLTKERMVQFNELKERSWQGGDGTHL